MSEGRAQHNTKIVCIQSLSPYCASRQDTEGCGPLAQKGCGPLSRTAHHSSSGCKGAGAPLNLKFRPASVSASVEFLI
jgi:hypothetical protein